MNSVRLESSGNSNWGSISLDYHEKDYQFPYYVPTGEAFNYDPVSLIRLKCFALIGLTPLVSIIRSVYYLAASTFAILSEIYRYLDGQSSDTSNAIYENTYDSIRALGYGALMTGCALMGIFAPYEGRLHYGWLERELNHHLDGPHRDKFYLAICFQRLCILTEDDEDGEQAASKLAKYLDRINAIRSAIWTCSIQQLMVELRIRPARP